MTLPSGMTSKVSTEGPGVERWIFSVLASRASHTQSPDSGVEKLMNAISGLTPLESFGKWDQATSSLRTSQVCLFPTEGEEVTLQPWLENFPPSGTMRSGTAYRLRPLVPRTSVGGGGALPTPQAADALGIGRPMEQMYRTESGKVRFKSNQGVDGAAPLHTIAATGMWPTPTSTERSGINPNTGKGEGLSKTAKMFPTPVADGDRQTNYKQGGTALGVAARLWPTPRASESYQGDGAAQGYAEAGFKQPRHRYDKDGNMVQMADYGKTGQGTFDTTLTTAVKAQQLFPTPRAGKTTDEDEDEESWMARHADGKVATPPLALAARLWATPRVDDSKNNGSASQQERHGPALNVQVKQMLPTPNASDAKDANMKDDHDVDRGYLRGVVNLLPTPSSGGDSGGPHGIRGGSWPTPKSTTSGPDHARQFREGSGGDDLVTAVNGSLSPDWVSWLMGLPVGWTSLEPLPREEYLDWFHAQQDGTWWQIERGLPRVATGIKDRVSRLKCLGNGIVPASLALFLRGTR